jgi:uncharacterized protein
VTDGAALAPALGAAASPEPFEIEGADGGPLRGDLYPAPGEAPVLLCHGFRSYKDWGFLPLLASRLAAEGLPAVAFSFSGSGVVDRAGAFGEPERFRLNTYTRELEDLRRVLEWTAGRFGARRRPGSSPRFGIVGHIRGGAIALLHAAGDSRIRCAATLATPRAIGVWPDDYYRSWERGEDALFLDFRTGEALHLGPQYLEDIRLLGDRLDVTRAVSLLVVPLLVVQGSRDTLVSMDEARALAAAGAANMTELLVVEGAGHGFQAGDVIRRTPPQLLDMVEAVTAWMRRWLAAPEAGEV